MIFCYFKVLGREKIVIFISFYKIRIIKKFFLVYSVKENFFFFLTSCIFKDESKEFESSSSDLDIVIEISLLSDNLVKLRPLSITESENGDASYEVGYRVSDDLRLFIEESLDEDHFELLLGRLIKSLVEFNHISLEQNSGEVSETLIWVL